MRVLTMMLVAAFVCSAKTDTTTVTTCDTTVIVKCHTMKIVTTLKDTSMFVKADTVKSTTVDTVSADKKTSKRSKIKE